MPLHKPRALPAPLSAREERSTGARSEAGQVGGPLSGSGLAEPPAHPTPRPAGGARVRAADAMALRPSERIF